jgi:hypothetical protein
MLAVVAVEALRQARPAIRFLTPLDSQPLVEPLAIAQLSLVRLVVLAVKAR